MIRAAAGTVLGGIAFLAALELWHPAEIVARRWLRTARAPAPDPRWTAGRAGW